MVKSLKLNNVYAFLCLACRPKKLFSRAAILLSALFFSLSIFSCDNSSSDNMALFAAPTPAQPAATVNENGKQMVVFSGCLGGAAGAFPARMSAQVSALLDGGQSDGLSMSAAPTLDTEAGGGYEMFATATAEGMPAVEGVFGTTAADKRFFSMSLEVGKTWSVVCGIRAAGGGSVMEDSYDFEAKITSPVLSRAFNLTPKKDGSGSVALSVTADSTVTKAVALCFDEAWKQAAPEGAEKELDLTSTAALSVGSLKSGSYEVSLNFFKDDGSGGRVFLYSVLQTINVFDNAATDMWISSAGEGKIQTAADGKTSLVVDGSEIMASARTIFYVSDTAGAAALGVSAPSDSNSGSAYEPLESLGRAAQIIAAAGNSANKKEYKIFVNGNVPCAASLDSSLDAVASGITITGLGASGSSDALQGNGSNSVVTLATKAPVTIKNLSVTGGGGSSGAGVNIAASGARLVLASGAKVIGNIAATSGGGVSVCAGAELDMLAGSEISANVCDGNGAGGVQNHGTFKMSGGTIENNKANNVGAVLVEEGSIFEISGSASIPYGALDSSGNLETGEGKNDVFLSAITDGGGAVETITVAGNLYASGTVATIHAKDWPRGKQVLAAGAGVSSLSDDILEKFDFTDTDFHVNRNKSDARQGLLAGDIYVAGSGYRHCLADGRDADGVTGTKNAPFASISYAASKILDGGKNTILVDGSLGAQEITSALLADNCSELTIKGWSDATHPALGDDRLPVNKLDAGGSGTAFKTQSAVPIVMENLMITGGNGYNGGGVVINSGSSVTLGTGAVVAGNKASQFGGGLYVAGNLLIDGGVVGDASKDTHATLAGEAYSNRAETQGGGIFFTETGKVTLKSGIVAYNYAYQGGGIACSNSGYTEGSQMTLEGGEVRYNCCAPTNGLYEWHSFGGGLFINGAKFSFTGGEIYGNYGIDGGGGLFLQSTIYDTNKCGAAMTGGSIHDNVYKDDLSTSWKFGSDLLLWGDAALHMSGGKIYSATQKERGVAVYNATDLLIMSGSASISEKTPVFLRSTLDDAGNVTQVHKPIEIAGALTPPDPADLSKKNAYIVPYEWKRGLQVLKASDSILDTDAKKTLIAANVGRFATTDEEFDVKAKDAAGFISAPICVAALNHTGPGARRSPVNEGALGQKDWGAPSELPSARGTRSEPFAKMSQAVAQMTDKTAPYEILINGTIKGDVYACATFEGSNVGDVTIRGVNGDNSNDVLDADKLGATSDRKYPVLTFRGTTGAKISATIQDLKITGGNYLDATSGLPNGGGISASYTDISLAKGALIAGNQARQGGGLYIKQGNLFVYADARIGEDGDETAGWNMAAGQCSNSANDCGGGIYCDTGGVYLGYKDLLTVATGADKWTGGVYRNHASCDGGGIYVGDGECRLAEGNVSRNSCSGDTGGGGGIFAAAGVLSVTGGKICGNKTTGKNGGGVCIVFCEFSMSGGEICDNEAADGGGVCIGANNLDNSKFSLTGGEICGNKAADGGGIYGWDNVEVSLSGGKIANNDCGAARILSEKFTMGGSVWIPYGVTDGDTTVTGVGKNDVILAENRCITIESALSLPTGASGANATITPAGWKRGTVIAQGKDGDQLPTGTKGRLALTDTSNYWEIYTSGDNKQAKIKAPICVAPADYSETPGSDSNIGTYTKPYKTVTKALTDLNDPEVDYEIYIKGTVVDHVTIDQTTTENAKSLLIQGYNYSNLGSSATDTLSGGCVADTAWEATGIGRTLGIMGDVPVTIKGLMITGGKDSNNGGGIFVGSGANLTLSYFTRVKENYSAANGAGVYVNAGGTLNVKKNVTVKDNKMIDASTGAQTNSNVFLSSGKVINILDSLKGLGSEGDSEIWVSTEDQPTISGTGDSATVTTVPITSGYKENNTNNGAVVSPGVYFKGDKYGVAFVGDEAALGVHGGGISVEDIYKNVALSIDKTWVKKADLSGALGPRFIVSGTIDGQAVNFITPTNDYYASISLKLFYHGEEIPQTSSYYSVTNCYLYPYSGLSAGDYVLAATVVYKGKTYNASFEIKVIGDSVPDGYVMTGGETVTGAVGTKAVSSVFITGRTVDIPIIIACDHEVTQAEYEKYCCYGNLKPTDTHGMGDDYPVYNVSWYDALVYCNLRSMAEGLTPVYSIGGTTNPRQWDGVVAGTGDDLGKYRGTETGAKFATWNAVTFDKSADGWRLPTEAEWEYFARGANKEDFTYSGSDDETNFVWYNGNAGNKAKPVKTRHDSSVDPKNELGLYDMSGNVYEWCWDWKGTIDSSTPATGPTSASKVIRGGSACDELTFCSVSSRYYAQSPHSPNYDIGFRVVRNAR